MISDLVGKTFNEVVYDKHSDEIRFNGPVSFRMAHDQECCEHVSVEDINGDLDDLIGTEILVAESREADHRDKAEAVLNKLKGEEAYDDDMNLWTFYTIRTIKGSVDIRWYGHSNGYYGVSVNVRKLDNYGVEIWE